MSTTTELRTMSATFPPPGYVALKIASPSADTSFRNVNAPNGNASAGGPSVGSTASTLRSLYPRAARALVQRDFPLTQSLADSAFALLPPPSSESSIPDELDTQRRKWEILRITLETSVYISPLPSTPKNELKATLDSLPSTLRANQLLSAPALIATLHTRSVRLFSPDNSTSTATTTTSPSLLLPQGPRAAFLPAQILVTLVLASLKLECPEVGRSMIEDWLAQQDPINQRHQRHSAADREGYKRVVELFCLHVLPRLQDWEYAQEFLEYEQELPPDTRSVRLFFLFPQRLFLICDI